jgi:hypothetical protein
MLSSILTQKKNLLPAVIQTAKLFDVSDNRAALVKNTEQTRDIILVGVRPMISMKIRSTA